MNIHQLWKSFPKEDRGYKSAYSRSVDSLVKAGYLRVIESEPWPGERRKRTYQITLMGYMEVLKQDSMWQCIGEVADNNKEILPEYFELWNHFRKTGIEEIAKKLHKYAIEKLREGLPSFPNEVNGRKPTLKEWLIKSSIFPEAGVLDRDENRLWTTSIIRNEKSYRIYLETIKWMYRAHYKAIKNWQDAYIGVLAWQLKEIITNIRDPSEQIAALKRDKDLWENITTLHPDKDEEELLAFYKEVLKKQI